MKNKAPNQKPPIKKGTMKRLFKLLFHDYPGMLTITIVCIIISSIVGVLPAVYIKTLTSYIVEGLNSDWSSIKGKVITSVTIMIGLLVFGYLFGILGMIFATPIMASIKIIASYYNEKYNLIGKLKEKTNA